MLKSVWCSLRGHNDQGFKHTSSRATGSHEISYVTCSRCGRTGYLVPKETHV